jgi:hypothetical protein
VSDNHAYVGERSFLQVDMLETYAGDWSPCEVCGLPFEDHQLDPVEREGTIPSEPDASLDTS